MARRDKLTTVAERLHEARWGDGEDLSRTQQWLAGELGVAVSTVSKWENGHTVPDVPMFERLADVLERSASWLAFGEGEP